MTIKVEGMSCAHCEKAVVNAVTAIAGVTSAVASAKDGTVIVEGNFDLAAVKAAITEADYDVVE